MRRALGLAFALVTVSSIVGLTAGEPVTTPAKPASAGVARNLVFVSLDTVRRDHLSTYGYERKTSPHLDALAGDAVVFDDAYAQESNTNPSHASMFTGVYPRTHGSLVNGVELAPEQITLAQILKGAGFKTAGFVSASAMRGKASGLDRGFDVYDEAFEGFRRDGAETTRRAAGWLAKLSAGERYFLFLHLYDTHGPYLPPAPYDKMFRSAEPRQALQRVPPYQHKPFRDRPGEWDLRGYVDRYDGCVRYVDDRLGEFLSRVEHEDTVIVVVADHGETLGERFWPLDHGGQAFEEQFRIPLLIRAPGVEPRRSDAIVETIDILPTLLELLRVDRPAQRPVAGSSVVPLMHGLTATHRDRSFSSSRAVQDRHLDRGYRLDGQRRIHAVRAEGWKLIRYPGVKDDYVELYRLDTDPGERENIATDHPARVARYQDYLNAWMAGDSPTRPAPQLDPEIRKQLESLGYVE